MSAPGSIVFPTGFRSCQIMALDSDGLPAAVDENPYDGFTYTSPKTLGITNAAARRISHTGADTVQQVVLLPPQEAATAELHLGQLDSALEAILTSKKVYTIAEANGMVTGLTDLDGFNPTVALLAYTDARDDDGFQVWHSLLFPKAQLAPQESGLDAVPADRVYQVNPVIGKHHLWGTQYALATEGVLRGQMERYSTFGKPHVTTFLGDGVVTDFDFAVDFPATNIAKIAVYVNKVLKTTNLTKTTTGLSFTASYEPADGQKVVVFYETE